MGEILSAEAVAEVQQFAVAAHPPQWGGNPPIVRLCRSVPDLAASHEALRARLAEVEQALRTYGWHDDDCDQYQSHVFTDPTRGRCTCGFAAVLDKGEPVTSPDLPRERSDAERLAALNALREAEGNAPLLTLPPESSWADAHSVTFDKGEPDGE